MHYRALFSLCVILVMSILAGCGGTHGNPVTPGSGVPAESGLNRYLWGYFAAYADTETNEIEMVPWRMASKHLNVIAFLEQGPCYDCVQVTGMSNSGYGTKLVQVRITHPFSNLNLTGFDVRGVALFDAGHMFATSALTVPDSANGTGGELMNADGYTALYAAWTEGSGPGGIVGYIPGKLSSPLAPSAQLNGYKRFFNDTGSPPNERHAFYAGTELEQTFDIKMPTGQFIFGYAIDACWANPIIKPVTNPQTDFPPQANCAEPYLIEVTQHEIGTGLVQNGGKTILFLRVYDYQDLDSHQPPKVECGELFDGWVYPDLVEDGNGYAVYVVEIENINCAVPGQYKCLIAVEDNDNYSQPDWMDLTAYQVVPLTVYPEHGWAITWGGASAGTVATGMDFDSNGNIYISGYFSGTVDFDPGPYEAFHTTVGGNDAFIAEFSPTGEFIWARTWGSAGDDAAWDVAVGGADRIRVTGYFSGLTDFDPGPGSDFYQFGGSFVCKYNADGTYMNTLVWDATMAKAIEIDEDNNMYIAGYFEGENWKLFDFDPSDGDALRSPEGGRDGFVMKLSNLDTFIWAITWGSEDDDEARDLVLSEEDDLVFITGSFSGLVDFEPGAGNTWILSNGETDAYLLCFNMMDDYQWVATWGGAGMDSGREVAWDVEGDSGVYVTGIFESTVDFDSSVYSEDEHTSAGGLDAYVSCHDPEGKYQWAMTWGGTEMEDSDGIAIDSESMIYVTGRYTGTVDLDPTGGSDEHTAVGLVDRYLMKLGTDQVFDWAVGFGGEGASMGLGMVTIGADENPYIAGEFAGEVDFDPGAGLNTRVSAGTSDGYLNVVLKDGGY